MSGPLVTRMTSIVAVAGLLGLQACGSGKPDPKRGATYVPLCATALTKVQFDAGLLEGANLTPNEPQIVQQGPPVRVMCGAFKGSHVAVITFEVACDDPSEKACANVLSIDMNGERISGPIA